MAGASSASDQVFVNATSEPTAVIVGLAGTDATTGRVSAAAANRQTTRGVAQIGVTFSAILSLSRRRTRRSRPGPEARAAAGTPSRDDVPQCAITTRHLARPRRSPVQVTARSSVRCSAISSSRRRTSRLSGCRKRMASPRR